MMTVRDDCAEGFGSGGPVSFFSDFLPPPPVSPTLTIFPPRRYPSSTRLQISAGGAAALCTALTFDRRLLFLSLRDNQLAGGDGGLFADLVSTRCDNPLTGGGGDGAWRCSAVW